MNKYIWRTSLVWLLLIGSAAGVFFYRSRVKPNAKSEAHEPEPIAVGPAVGSKNTVTDEQRAVDVPLVPIQLTPERMQSIGVKTGTVEYQQLSDEIRATGTVAIDETRVSYVQIRFPGYVREVFANATFLQVHKGQPLFTVYSPDLVQTQREFLLAEQNEKAMEGSGVEGVASGSASLVHAAEERLRQWNFPESDIEKLRKTGKATTEIAINSPVSGYITERNALPNLYAEPSTRLYTIADLSRVWIDAQVFQDAIGRVRPGEAAEITLDAYPGQLLRGTVQAILPQVDAATRTVAVRLAVANPGLRLKPGMYVNVALKANAGRQLVVPASAVLESGLRHVAFLDQGDGRIEPKEVQLGMRVGDMVVVTGGLQVHQKIVTSANFLIDSESQIQSAAGAPEAAPPATSSQSSSKAATQVKVSFSTHPDPPSKGPNKIDVTVTEANGTPCAGADVSAVFFMAAMPAMGMPASRVTAHLNETRAGNYSGTATLDSGGTWQLTITVKRNGQVIAVKSATIAAAGGM
jgi:Cu(I)/Ag(I) efflux system membrane fusion protein/cobalt-zinc-cadmium efflux system membrane fusion protein